MSNNALKLWRESVNQYYTSKGQAYQIPKKNTEAYAEIKKIYERKKGGKTEEEKGKTKCKNCKNYVCRCKCPYDKPPKK